MDRAMIRIERGKEVSPGVWAYTVRELGLCGKSRQPLLDACRQIKSLGGFTAHRAGVFREGRAEPDISCRVGIGAELTVSEPANRGRARFVPYRAYSEAAE
jgi:hypothetical protein